MSEKTKKIIKYISIFLITLCVICLMIILVLFISYKTSPNMKDSYNIDFNDDCSLVIKEDKLYDEKNDEFITIDDRNKNLKSYIPRKIYKFSDIYLLVLAKQEINDDFVNLKANDQYIYFIDPKYDKFTKLNNRYYEEVSANFSKLETLNETVGIAPLYENDALDVNVGFVMFSSYLINNNYHTYIYYMYRNDSNYKDLEIYNYAINNDYLLVNLTRNNKIENHIFDFDFEFTENGYSQQLDYLDKEFKDEKYINQGYFAKVNDDIVYLDNNLNVVNIDNKEIIESLNSIEEFNTKYKNKN